MTVDLNAVRAQLVTIKENLAEPLPPPPVEVAVVDFPPPRHRWVLTVQRDATGLVAAIVAEPLT